MAVRLKSLVAAALLATCLLARSPHASQVGPLTTFVPGTAAKASEVNGNFTAVVAAVNDDDARITALQSNSRIGSNLTLDGNLTLAEPSTATAGSIMKGTRSFLHDPASSTAVQPVGLDGLGPGQLGLTGSRWGPASGFNAQL